MFSKDKLCFLIVGYIFNISELIQPGTMYPIKFSDQPSSLHDISLGKVGENGFFRQNPSNQNFFLFQVCMKNKRVDLS